MNIVSRHVRRRADAAAMSVIVLFFVLFFSWILFTEQFLVGSDAFVYSYPLRMVAWDAIRHATLPLWTPLIFSGYPLLSMSQLALAYPLTWGYLFLPGHWAEQVYVLAPYLLAPAFTYAYARETGRSRTASLLAGFAFGYGGIMIGVLGAIGFMTNAVMWLPLMLIPIERARTRSYATCLLWATGAYTMSVLNGLGQGFLFVGMIATAYAAFISTTSAPPSGGRADEPRGAAGWVSWRRWRPLAVAVGAISLSVGVAAFQILETMRAVRHSIRRTLTYEIFTEGSFTPLTMWRAFVVPVHDRVIPTYVPPLVVCLALFAGVAAVGRRQPDVRIFFWLGTATLACILMLGVNTPFYPVLYHVPFFNLFRVPMRHSFAWTFAVSILAAYGWDACDAALARVRKPLALSDRRQMFVGIFLLLLGVVVGALWWRWTTQPPTPGAELYTGLQDSWPLGFSESSYLLWKTLFTLLTLAILWQSWRIAEHGWRTPLLTGAVVLICFVEPFTLVWHRWQLFAKPAARYRIVSPATRFLQQYPPQENRIYTRVGLFVEEFEAKPRLDPPNLTALHGLHNVGGYEPLILERYSRALGNVTLDAVSPRPGFAPTGSLFDERAHVLDLLNTSFVVSFANLATAPEALVEKEKVKFIRVDTPTDLPPGASTTLSSLGSLSSLGGTAEVDTLALVTSLSHSATETQGTAVAKLLISTIDGRTLERELRVGVDTAEWAHERTDVRNVVRHKLAPVFDSRPGDSMNSFASYRYWSRIPLGERLRVTRVEIVNQSQNALLALWATTLYDSTNSESHPLLPFGAGRWQTIYNREDVLILRNERALPRAWLVAEAEAVDGEEALKRIRGEGAQSFDPRRTALLEVPPNELPALPGGMISPDAAAQVVEYEANRLVVETMGETSSVLVLSEMNYPGWVASVDGISAPIHATNFLLRGVVVPAGRHRVEMRYTAPAARNGALISVFTLLLVGGTAIYGRRVSWLSR